MENPETTDSIDVLVGLARTALLFRPNDSIAQGIERTGGEAKKIYIDYLVAKSSTINWENALKLCQEQN